MPDRPINTDSKCSCHEGWGGVNCNVCTEDSVCKNLVHYDDDLYTCYKGGLPVKRSFQTCGIESINSFF